MTVANTAENRRVTPNGTVLVVDKEKGAVHIELPGGKLRYSGSDVDSAMKYPSEADLQAAADEAAKQPAPAGTEFTSVADKPTDEQLAAGAAANAATEEKLPPPSPTKAERDAADKADKTSTVFGSDDKDKSSKK